VVFVSGGVSCEFEPCGAKAAARVESERLGVGLDRADDVIANTALGEEAVDRVEQ
jgi:hypothetical protein